MPPRCASPRIDKVYVNYPRSSRHSPSWQRDFSLASYERIKLLFLASQAGAHAIEGDQCVDERFIRFGHGGLACHDLVLGAAFCEGLDIGLGNVRPPSNVQIIPRVSIRRRLGMLLNEGEFDGVRVLRAETVRQMTQNAVGNMPTIRGPGWGFTLGFGIVTDPAAAKSRLPAGSYGWGGIYGTQFWIDPANRVVGLVMTQTAIIGSGAISNPVREAFYTAD